MSTDISVEILVNFTKQVCTKPQTNEGEVISPNTSIFGKLSLTEFMTNMCFPNHSYYTYGMVRSFWLLVLDE